MSWLARSVWRIHPIESGARRRAGLADSLLKARPNGGHLGEYRMSEAGKTLPAIGTVLCGVDSSRTAATALYTAASLAHHHLSRLVVVRVDPREETQKALADLETFVGGVLRGPAWYTEKTTLVVKVGDPASVLLAEARAQDAALLVMGTRGRSRAVRVDRSDGPARGDPAGGDCAGRGERGRVA